MIQVFWTVALQAQTHDLTLIGRVSCSFSKPFFFSDESQRQQYEEWLGETQQLLQMQQRLLEDQIAAHRKAKKALSAKQRTAKRAGRAFAEEDAAQLQYISEQQGAVQKQLEQVT